MRKRQRRFSASTTRSWRCTHAGCRCATSTRISRNLGVKVGRDLISAYRRVIDDAREWTKRPLEDIYPIISLTAWS